MQETEREDQATASEEAEIDDEEVFFRDVSEDLDDEERSSYAILLILAVGGFAVGASAPAGNVDLGGGVEGICG